MSAFNTFVCAFSAGFCVHAALTGSPIAAGFHAGFAVALGLIVLIDAVREHAKAVKP